MLKYIFTYLSICITTILLAQPKEYYLVFQDIQSAQQTPKVVYHLNLSESNLKSVPDEVLKFTNLKIF